MLDIKFIRENADKVRKAIADKRTDINLDDLLDLDQKRRDLLTEVESLQATKNQVSKEIPALQGSEREAKIMEMKEVDTRQTALSDELREVQAKYDDLMLRVPNIPSPETPIGKDDSENLPWRYWSPELGDVDPKDTDKVAQVPPKFGFELKDHAELITNLDLADLEAGVKTSGFRGYYLKNEAVLLQYGLMWHAMEKLRAKGFTIMSPPTLVREFALTGAGAFPTGRDEVYQVVDSGRLASGTAADKEPIYLVGTSEQSLLAYYADKILEEKDLPIKVAGISPCYRSEIGSYSKDLKGLYRVHEFMKVEQVVLCKAETMEGDQWLENLREIAEEMLQDLKLSYRVLNICTGDMGAGKYKMYDVETWMAARGKYGETHSDSNLTDWQARRMNIRYRDAEGKIKFAYTLNNTAVASPRILIAILENYQQPDGSVKVPEVLQKYVGTDVIKPKA